MTVLLALNLSAQDNEIYWTPDNLPMEKLVTNMPGITYHVVNPDTVLKESTVDSLNSVLRRLEADKGVQTVVIAVKHIQNDDPFTFAMDLGKKYGIGHKKKDDGLIVMLCKLDRSCAIFPGKGLEGTLPDAICKRIQMRVMVPYLKEEKWDSAMIASIEAIDGYVRGDETIVNTLKANEEEGDGWTAILWFFGGIIGIVWLLIYLSQKKCPQCKKGKMAVTKKELVEIDGKKKYHTHYKCKKCGYEMDEYQDPPSHNPGSSAGRIAGGMMGMGGFGSRGGGSIGHFGGGSFGGGGSVSRF